MAIAFCRGCPSDGWMDEPPEPKPRSHLNRSLTTLARVGVRRFDFGEEADEETSQHDDPKA